MKHSSPADEAVLGRRKRRTRAARIATVSLAGIVLAAGMPSAAFAVQAAPVADPVPAPAAAAAAPCVIESATITTTPTAMDDSVFPDPMTLDGKLLDGRASVKTGIVTAKMKLVAGAKGGDTITVGRTLSASTGLSDLWVNMVWPAELKASDGTVLAQRTSTQNWGVYKLTDAVNELDNVSLTVAADRTSYGYRIDPAVFPKPSTLEGAFTDTTFATCDGATAKHRVNFTEVRVTTNAWGVSTFSPTRSTGTVDVTAASETQQHTFLELALGDGKESLIWDGRISAEGTIVSGGADTWTKTVDRTLKLVTGSAPLQPGQYRLTVSADKKKATIEVYEFAKGEVTTFRAGLEQVAAFPDPELFVGIDRTHKSPDGKTLWSVPGATFADPGTGGKAIFLDPTGSGNGEFNPIPVVTSISAVDVAGPVAKGESVDWLVENTNAHETRTVRGVTTTVTLPAGLDYVSSSDGGVWDAAKRTVTWPAEDVPAKGKTTHTVTTKVATDAEGQLEMPVVLTGDSCAVEGSVCEDTASIEPRRPGIETEKQSSVSDTNKDGILGTAGDVITYTILATNTGNAPEKSVLLTDELLGIKDQECLPEGVILEAGASIECAGELTYTITKEDAKRGSVLNTATLEVPGLPPVPDEKEDPTWAPDFEFTKRVDQVVDANKNKIVGDPGDRIDYGFSVHNTGNRVLETVKISDPKIGLKDVECLAPDTSDGAKPGALQPLKVDESVDCVGEYSYIITEKDVEAKNVVNVATATSPGVPEREDTVTTPVKPGPKSTPTLAVTGAGTNGTLLGSAAALLVAAGATTMVVRRKRRQTVGADIAAE